MFNECYYICIESVISNEQKEVILYMIDCKGINLVKPIKEARI